MTPPRNSMNQKDPSSFSNRPAHADPRDLHRPQLQPSGKSPSRLLSYGITSRGTRLPESRREQDRNGGKEEERDYMSRPLTERRKEISPRMEEGKEQREGDFHLSSTRLTVLRCLHRVTGWAGRGEARERTGRLLLPLATARTLNSGI